MGHTVVTAAYFSFKVMSAKSDFRRYTTGTRYNDTVSKTALVAIDIAKAKNDIVIERPGAIRRQRLKIQTTNHLPGACIFHP